MDDDRPPALSAIKAAQASLAEGLTHLRVVTAARGIGAPLEEGESVRTAPSDSSVVLLDGLDLRRQLSQFFPGGLGGGSREGGSGWGFFQRGYHPSM
jgi:hypothetical protein